MKLRHKKPLNPYKGQTNNDKNEFNDDDFRHQTSSAKKVMALNNEQVYKYARLLTKFVKIINEDCKLHNSESQEDPPSQPPASSHPQILLQHAIPPMHSNTQAIKQPKSVLNLQTKFQNKHQNKQKPVIKSSYTPLSNMREPKIGLLNQSKTVAIDLEKPSEASQMPKNNFQNLTNPIGVSRSTTPTGEGGSSQNAKFGMEGNVNPLNMMMNPYAMGMNMNQMPLSQMEINQLILRNMQLMSQQNYKPPLYAMDSFNNNFSLNMGQPAYNPMNNLLNFAPMSHPFMNQLNFLKSFPEPFKPPINLFNEQLKAHMNTNKSEGKDKQSYPLKRAAYHVTIAYKIYLDKFKKQGKSMENIEELDPTRFARRIKNQTQNPNSKDKDTKNKKK